MNIAVVAANGNAGKLIVKEAVERGNNVTAIVRGENKTVAQNTLIKDIFSITKEDLKDFDAVVDAAGGWTEETFSIIPNTVKHLCEVLKGSNTRLLVVGGAGSLYINPEHTLTVADGPDFPDAFKAVAKAHQDALDYLRKVNDVNWTYISPAGDFQIDGERSGTYILAGEDFTLNERGESIISYADYAIAMVDEIESGNHIKERISVVRK